MYKVVIVDDESWIVESLKIDMDWEQHGFQIVGEAYNGIEAFELIQRLMPDVVFTDIRMPGMSGLELIKKVNELSLNIQFIIVSGYAEFAYAQKALNYGAVGYCLKPFDETEIYNLLEKVKQKFNNSKASLEFKLLELLDSRDMESQTLIKEILKELGLNLREGKNILALVSIGTGELKPSDCGDMVTLKVGVNKRAYLLQYNEHLQIKELLSSKITGEILSIGIGRVDNMNFNEAIESANISAYNTFITSKKGVYEIISDKPEDINKVLRMLDEAIRNKDIASVQTAFDHIASLFKSDIFDIRDAFRFYNTVNFFVYNMKEEYEYFIYRYEQLVDSFNNVQNMISYLRELVIKQLKVDDSYEYLRINNETVRTILQYVNDNFYQQISIQDLSQKYYINPCYISQLFKKEVGETFTEYLSRLRISHACKMLSNSKLPIYEIGEKVGYTDYFYFCRIFKKITAKTPTQYREEMA